MATAFENNALADDAAEVYFSTEYELQRFEQNRTDIESGLLLKKYEGDVSINELKANSELTEQTYEEAIQGIARINEQRTGVAFDDGRSNYDVLFQFFRVDNTGADSIVNATGDRKLYLDGSDNVVIANYP